MNWKAEAKKLDAQLQDALTQHEFNIVSVNIAILSSKLNDEIDRLTFLKTPHLLYHHLGAVHIRRSPLTNTTFPLTPTERLRQRVLELENDITKALSKYHQADLNIFAQIR